MTSRELLFAGRYSEARAAAAAAAGIEDYPDSAQIAKNPGECIIWAASTWPSYGADYSATQYAGPVTVAKFERPVRVGDHVGTRFAVGDKAAIRRLGIKRLIALS